MAGTPRQREDASINIEKTGQEETVVMSGECLKVSDDYVTRSEREREAARKRASQGLDTQTLTPIVNRDSGAFGPRSEPTRGRRWRGRTN
jgi:hypothetical protein